MPNQGGLMRAMFVLYLIVIVGGLLTLLFLAVRHA